VASWEAKKGVIRWYRTKLNHHLIIKTQSPPQPPSPASLWSSSCCCRHIYSVGGGCWRIKRERERERGASIGGWRREWSDVQVGSWKDSSTSCFSFFTFLDVEISLKLFPLLQPRLYKIKLQQGRGEGYCNSSLFLVFRKNNGDEDDTY